MAIEIYEGELTGSEVDALLSTVSSSNLSATHKITRSATLVIAASDSSAKSKAQADYVCDGTDDNVEIQAAIDALPTGGGTVLLLEGVFRVATDIAMRSNVTLEGTGFSTILMLNPNTNKNIITATDVSNFCIQSMLLDGNKDNNTDQNNILLQNGIHIEHCYRSVVSTLIIQNCEESGIHVMPVNGATGSELAYNTFLNIVSHNNTKCGMYINSYAEYMQISNCVFANNGTYGVCNLSANLTFSSCIMCENAGSGVGIIVESKTTNNTFTGCQVNHNLGHGFRLHSVFGTQIENCKIIANRLHGILLHGGSQHIVTGNVVSTNCYETTGNDNICIEDSSSYNIITNNSIQKSSGAARYGINEISGDYNIISKNGIGAHGTAPVYKTGLNTIFEKNIGYVTDKTGNATITAAATTVEVTHGLAAAPTRVLLSPTTATAGKQYYVSAKADTTFTITIDSAHSADITFDWQAIV